MIDSEHSLADSFPTAQLARTPAAAIYGVWADGRHVRWTPHGDTADAERVAEACHELGRCVLLVDEASYYLHGGTRTGSHFLRLVRAHRHSEIFVLFTTQHFSGDIPQAAFGGAPPVYVFQTTAPAALKRLEAEWGLDPDRVRRLEKGRCFVLQTGGP